MSLIFIQNSNCWADATIKLSNYEAQMPVFFQKSGTLATVQDGIYVEVWGGPVGGVLFPIAIIGSTNTAFQLNKDGYFDAGVGIIPGLTDNAQADVQVRAWSQKDSWNKGNSLGKSMPFPQETGSWDPKSGAAPSGPPLQMRNSVIVAMPIPEPSAIALGLLGGTALITNRIIKATIKK